MTFIDLQDAIHEISYKTAVSLAKSSRAEKLIANRTNILNSELKPRLDEIKILSSDGMIQLNESGMISFLALIKFIKVYLTVFELILTFDQNFSPELNVPYLTEVYINACFLKQAINRT